MALIHLVRHGQASFGAANYDVLSPLGERQSMLLGRWFAHTRLAADHVALGALERHRATAEACVAAWGHEAERIGDAGFDEYHSDDVLAHARPDLATHDAMSAFLAASEDAHRAFQAVFLQATERWIAGEALPYREPWHVFSARCREALLRTVAAAEARAGSEATLCIFTSGGVIGTLCQQALGLPDEQAMRFAWVLRNTSVTTLRTRGGRTLLDGFNQLGHLQAEGDPALLTYL